jgi:NAD(P)H dehydrogenase (quinone)
MSAGGPLRRILARLWIGNKNARQIIQKLRSAGGPADVKAQQEKIARADALAIISPVYFVGFPAILKGWIDRVFSLGFAFGFTPEAWRGDISGRLPLFRHKKALIINTTIFDEKSYETNGMRAAMKVLIDDYMFRYPGIEAVEHKYFYAVHGADIATRKAWLEEAYQLGRSF